MPVSPDPEIYRERLWPSPWVFVATALVIPASLLVFLPISVEVGIATAGVLYAACVTALIVTSPVISVTDTVVTAGRARLPIGFAGKTTVFRGDDATRERGQNLDARAWLVIRGWVAPIVTIEVTDKADPAPYWLVSSRHPERLADAIHTAASGQGQRTD